VRPRRFPLRAVLFVIQLYRHTISPLRLPSCRFTPTCSQYAVDALTEFGVIRGGWLAVVPDRVADPAEYRGDAAEAGRGVIDDLTNTVQQGESRTRV